MVSPSPDLGEGFGVKEKARCHQSQVSVWKLIVMTIIKFLVGAGFPRPILCQHLVEREVASFTRSQH